jgi:hypothetical protein
MRFIGHWAGFRIMESQADGHIVYLRKQFYTIIVSFSTLFLRFLKKSRNLKGAKSSFSEISMTSEDVIPWDPYR